MLLPAACYRIFYFTMDFTCDWASFMGVIHLLDVCYPIHEDYAFDNHKISFNAMKNDLKQKQTLSYGFGLAVML